MKDTVTMLVDALRGTVAELEDVLHALNEERMPHDGDEFHERLKAGKAALSAAKGGGWLPIESAPKDGTEILVARGKSQGVVFFRDDKWCLGVFYGYFHRPTAWQPLPPPPKD